MLIHRIHLRRLPRFVARLRRSRFARDRRGVSAVEFALIAPIMIGLYFGCVEVSDAVAVDRKVSLTAAALANLSAQVTTISSNDMTTILRASGAIRGSCFPTSIPITVPSHRSSAKAAPS